MKKALILFFLIFTPILSLEAKDDPPNPQENPAQDQEMAQFYEELQREIQKQEAKLNHLLKQLQDKSQIPSAVITLEAQVAYEMLEVKRILYANFVETPSVEFPQIRKKLLAIMKKDLITTADLAELNALVRILNA